MIISGYDVRQYGYSFFHLLLEELLLDHTRKR